MYQNLPKSVSMKTYAETQFYFIVASILETTITKTLK